MTVRLRAHHLLCMLTFVGEGYTPSFTRNYRRIAGRLSAGEEILMVSGPDDICAPLLAEPDHHCLRDSVFDRDRRAASAVANLLGLPGLAQGDRITPDAAMLARMRTAFGHGAIRDGCHGCEWSNLCSRVAERNFQGVLVGAPPTRPAAG